MGPWPRRGDRSIPRPPAIPAFGLWLPTASIPPGSSAIEQAGDPSDGLQVARDRQATAPGHHDDHGLGEDRGHAERTRLLAGAILGGRVREERRRQMGINGSQTLRSGPRPACRLRGPPVGPPRMAIPVSPAGRRPGRGSDLGGPGRRLPSPRRSRPPVRSCPGGHSAGWIGSELAAPSAVSVGMVNMQAADRRHGPGGEGR